jgi:GTP-binding protein
MMLLVNEKIAQLSDFLPGMVCAAIIRSNSGTVDAEYKADLSSFIGSVRKYTIADVNLVLRVLARYRLYEDIFQLFTTLRASRVRPNTESMEFLSNALVATVDKGIKADTMRDLPSIDAPEVVFVGRSNVGKSSLVKFLLNRKALASTSAVPGHTQHFHFFNINSQRTDLPKFTFVDVPGLGYAETVDGNQQVSWKSLIQRYLSKRSSLKVVCHLIDSRHKVTPTDEEMFEIFLQAVNERRENGEEQFAYAIVLTKVDKVGKKVLNENIKDVNRVAARIMEKIASSQQTIEQTGNSDVEVTKVVPLITTTGKGSDQKIQIILSSSRSKEGADDIWKLIQAALTKKLWQFN